MGAAALRAGADARAGAGALLRDEDERAGAEAEPAPLLCASSLRTTWIVRRIVLVRTSAVGVAVGWAAATVVRGGAVGRAIAAAATPPSAERTARAATAGVRRLMPTASDPAPQATGSPRESFGKACAERGCVRELPVYGSQETHPSRRSDRRAAAVGEVARISRRRRPRDRALGLCRGRCRRRRHCRRCPSRCCRFRIRCCRRRRVARWPWGRPWRSHAASGSGEAFGCGSGDGCGLGSVRPTGRTRASTSASAPGRDPR